MAKVSTKQLAHQFDQDIFANMAENGRKVSEFLTSSEGMVGEAVAKESFSEKSLETVADRYIDIMLGYGYKERRAFLDGVHYVLNTIKKIKGK